MKWCAYIEAQEVNPTKTKNQQSEVTLIKSMAASDSRKTLSVYYTTSTAQKETTLSERTGLHCDCQLILNTLTWEDPAIEDGFQACHMQIIVHRSEY